MPRRAQILSLVVVALVGVSCDSGDGRTLADPTTSTSAVGTAADGGGSDDVLSYAAGSGTLTVSDGETLSFQVTFCRLLREVPADADGTVVTLSVEGAGATASSEPFSVSIVKTAGADPEEDVIETISVRFGDTAETPPTRIWEAQRVTDPATGTVRDFHGEGTTPLLSTTAGEASLEITAPDAAYHQFDLAGGDAASGPAGVATLDLTCS